MSITDNTVRVHHDLKVRRVAGRIGAEISGVKLSADLDRGTLDDIKALLLRHKVIFFRDQGHLDDEAQEAFATRLGAPVAHPTVPPLRGTNYVLELNSERGGRANSWHTDVTFVDAYPQASVLRAVVSPSVGGDTVWANAAAGYNDLPPALRDLADRLWAVHTNLYDYAANRPETNEEDVKRHREVFAATVYETEHPLVRIHPETGEKTLILGHFLKNIVGLSKENSQNIFSTLQSYVTRLENTVRWTWRAGDVAIWDNRATQHYAINDYDEHRVMHRVTIAGDVPLSVDGKYSRTISKAPLSAPKVQAAE